MGLWSAWLPSEGQLRARLIREKLLRSQDFAPTEPRTHAHFFILLPHGPHSILGTFAFRRSSSEMKAGHRSLQPAGLADTSRPENLGRFRRVNAMTSILFNRRSAGTVT